MRLWVTGKERRERGSEKVRSARETEERRTIQWKEREWATNGAFEGTREKVLVFPVRGKERERQMKHVWTRERESVSVEGKEQGRDRVRPLSRLHTTSSIPGLHTQLQLHRRRGSLVCTCETARASISRSQSSLRRYAVCINDALSSRYRTV